MYVRTWSSSSSSPYCATAIATIYARVQVMAACDACHLRIQTVVGCVCALALNRTIERSQRHINKKNDALDTRVSHTHVYMTAERIQTSDKCSHNAPAKIRCSARAPHAKATSGGHQRNTRKKTQLSSAMRWQTADALTPTSTRTSAAAAALAVVVVVVVLASDVRL